MNDRQTNKLRDVRVREKKLEYQRPQATFLVFSTDASTMGDLISKDGGSFGPPSDFWDGGSFGSRLSFSFEED